MSESKMVIKCEKSEAEHIYYKKESRNSNVYVKHENRTHENCCKGVLCATLKKNRIMVICENAPCVQDETSSSMGGSTDHEKDEINEILTVCVDGSAKEENMGGYVYIRKDDEIINIGKSTSKNQWHVNRLCAAEARTMLELCEILVNMEKTADYKAMQIITDNKMLMRIM